MPPPSTSSPLHPIVIPEILVPPHFTCLGTTLLHATHARETPSFLASLLLDGKYTDIARVPPQFNSSAKKFPHAWWRAQCLLYGIDMPKSADIARMRDALVRRILDPAKGKVTKKYVENGGGLEVPGELVELEFRMCGEFRKLNAQVRGMTAAGEDGKAMGVAKGKKKADASASAVLGAKTGAGVKKSSVKPKTKTEMKAFTTAATAAAVAVKPKPEPKPKAAQPKPPSAAAAAPAAPAASSSKKGKAKAASPNPPTTTASKEKKPRAPAKPKATPAPPTTTAPKEKKPRAPAKPKAAPPAATDPNSTNAILGTLLAQNQALQLQLQAQFMQSVNATSSQGPIPNYARGLQQGSPSNVPPSYAEAVLTSGSSSRPATKPKKETAKRTGKPATPAENPKPGPKPKAEPKPRAKQPAKPRVKKEKPVKPEPVDSYDEYDDDGEALPGYYSGSERGGGGYKYEDEDEMDWEREEGGRPPCW